ncbi:hypothetical protein GXW82_11900 [Streptacidiphilus sp. 4-A2]|nr:hypothetical protein [Streptacidiphilus sp. 4-A2]
MHDQQLPRRHRGAAGRRHAQGDQPGAQRRPAARHRRPDTGALRPEPVTDAFSHSTDRLVDITLADGGTLTSTAGHRVFVDGRGWTYVADLHSGDRLRAADGSPHRITALRDRSGLPPQQVYDLTVDGLHTFYVRTTAGQDVLVHNCLDIVNDEGTGAPTPSRTTWTSTTRTCRRRRTRTAGRPGGTTRTPPSPRSTRPSRGGCPSPPT